MSGKKSILEMAEEPPAQLPVTVEAVIGHIDLGLRGRHPFEVGMGIIGRYHAHLLDQGAQPRDNVYRFPGPAENETIVVTINSEFSKED